MLPAHRVVTGIRFSHRNGHITHQVYATDFDFATGRLYPARSEWISYSSGDTGATEIKIYKRIDPRRKLHENIAYTPQSESGSYVRFGPTDLKSDLGQTTIPIIETQPLEPTNLAALSGIGLTYKNYRSFFGSDKTGGIIAPTLVAYETSIGDLIFETSRKKK